jgi:hypothetical protein
VPRFGPISRRDLLYYLRQLGFEGPVAATSHATMIRGTLKLRVPNPHQGDISRDFFARILREAGISRETWEAL